jgi:hypothetical protein
MTQKNMINPDNSLLQMQGLRQAQTDRARGHIELVEICAKDYKNFRLNLCKVN